MLFHGPPVAFALIQVAPSFCEPGLGSQILEEAAFLQYLSEKTSNAFIALKPSPQVMLK